MKYFVAIKLGNDIEIIETKNLEAMAEFIDTCKRDRVTVIKFWWEENALSQAVSDLFQAAA